MARTKTILIIGGGLSGLTLAYLAKQKNIQVTVLEAAGRPGGRIHTILDENKTPLELGATWFADQHRSLLDLIDELELRKFPQYDQGITLFQTKSFEPAQRFYIPESTQPSYRLAGGTGALIQTLAAKLPPDSLHLNAIVDQVQETDNGIRAILKDGRRFEGEQVFICLPPQVAAAHIHFLPSLPGTLQQLLPEVQTWMAGAVKFTVEYDRPFWRENGYSGMLYSHAGVITEMYDHANFEEDKFGFTGFLNAGVQHYDAATRREYVLSQLSLLFGEAAAHPTGYYDKIWNEPTLMAGQQIFRRAHFNNGHPALQEAYMNGKLLFAGSETASLHPGYMEGAVAAANQAALRL